jgi:hypothetical protein
MKMVEKTKVKYPRAPVKWYVSARAGGREIEGVTKNISTRQAYICCLKPPRLNEVLDMVFTLMLHKNLVYSDCGSKLSFALRPKSGEDPCEL